MQRENKNNKVIPNRGLYHLAAPRKVFIRGLITMIWNLQRRLLSLRNSERGRSRIKYGMTPNFNNSGFTLVELLVVVLIIGILAAVALPKYEMAVEKSRVTKAIVAVKNLSESMERYYLANGTYPRSFGHEDSLFWAELDMEMPVITDFDLFFSDQGYVGAWRFGSSRFDYFISRNLAYGGEGKKFKCWTAVLNDTSRSAQLCKQLCGGAELKKAWGGTPSTGCEF